MFIVVCNKIAFKKYVYKRNGSFYIYCCLCVEMSKNVKDPQNHAGKIFSIKSD